MAINMFTWKATKPILWILIAMIVWYWPTSNIAQDSLSVDIEIPQRKFSQHKIDSFLQDSDFIYDESWTPPDPTWFQRHLINFIRFLDKDRGGGFSIGKLIFYIIALLAILGILIGIHLMGIKNIFSRKAKEIPLHFEEIEGDIQKIDFEVLVSEAREQKRYRRGVRLLYLETLKILTQKNHIKWTPAKVNQEYLWELEGSRFYDEFNQLTQHYEFVCYGDFSIDHDGFDFVEKIFRSFQQKIGQST